MESSSLAGKGPGMYFESASHPETPASQQVPEVSRTSDYSCLNRRSYEELCEKAVVARRTLRTTAWASESFR